MQGLTLSITRGFRIALGFALWRSMCVLAVGAATGCRAHLTDSDTTTDRALRPAHEWVIASAPETERPPFRFAASDDEFLNRIEYASFLFLWNACDPNSGMVVDRSSVSYASIAGVGFQLAAIPCAVERGWISRIDGQERCARILRTLASTSENRKAGLFYHFLDGTTARPINTDAVSTIDSAIFFAGAIVAGEYFEGEIKERAERFFAEADWSFFVLKNPKPGEEYLKGFISLGWKPAEFESPTGEGSLLPYAWADAADEQRLVCFLAAAAPNPAHRVDPEVYYRLRRMLGESDGSGVHVWFPWSGALFTHFFAHCFIGYAAMGVDDPAAHGVKRRPRVDWWENARRGVHLHRNKAIRNPLNVPTLGANAWGLSACDAASGYIVPGVFPKRISTSDQISQYDFADFTPTDNFGDGTIPPYAAGCAVMFEPKLAMGALRGYFELKAPDGTPLVWREPLGGRPDAYGFQDSFNLGTRWVAPDCVAIDQGPLVLAIENARSGLVWDLFANSAVGRAAVTRLGLAPKGPKGSNE
jgi:hypothetical protein